MDACQRSISFSNSVRFIFATFEPTETGYKITRLKSEITIADKNDVIQKNKADEDSACDYTITKITSCYPFFQFPKVAKRCCQISGCYDKVKAAFKGIERNLMNPNSTESSTR